MLLLNPYEYVSVSQINHLLANSSSYWFWKDTHSRYLGCNESFSKLVQIDNPGSIKGASDFDLAWQIGGHTAEHFQAADKKAMSTQTITNQREAVLIPGESMQILMATKRPLVQNRKCIGVIGQSVDITSFIIPSLAEHAKPKTEIPIVSLLKMLSKREIDCLKYLLRGYSYKNIAAKLDLSARTVEHYIENIKDKLNCSNKQELLERLNNLEFALFMMMNS